MVISERKSSDTEQTTPLLKRSPYKIGKIDSSVYTLRDIKEEAREETDLDCLKANSFSNERAIGNLKHKENESTDFKKAMTSNTIGYNYKPVSKSQFSSIFSKDGSKTQFSRASTKRASIRKPKLMFERLQSLKALGNTKKIQEVQRDMIQDLVVNADSGLKEKYKMLDLVLPSY